MSKKRNHRTFGETKGIIQESEAILSEIDKLIAKDRSSRLSGEQKYNLLMLVVGVTGGLLFIGILFSLIAFG